MKVLSFSRTLLQLTAGLMALGLSATAWGTGCIQGDDGSAGPIVFAKGKQSCDTIKGYVGCTVDKGTGSCVIKDPSSGNTISTITSSIGANGALTWESSGPGKVFAAGLNGIQSGNACVYFYPGGEGTTQSGIGYNTSTTDTAPTFTNIQESFFCTDLDAKVVTTEPDLKTCKAISDTSGNNPIDVVNGVDCGSLADGAIVSVWTPIIENGQVTGQKLQQCMCNEGNTYSEADDIYACNLSGVNDGDPNTSENCFNKQNGDVEKPIILEFFPDAKTCSSTLGTVSCSCIDNPFTTCNECTGAGC